MSFFINFKIARAWRKSIRRNGGTLEIMIQNKAKIQFSFYANALASNVKKRSKVMLLGFLTKFEFTSRMRVLEHLVVFMQKKILNRYNTREAKLEILENCWNKFLFKMKHVND
jgi:hypothetical protein